VKHTVWVFTTVGVKFTDVEADSQVEAVKRVEAEADFHALLDRDNVEWAEEIINYHVDEENDTEYERSHWYDPDYIEQA